MEVRENIYKKSFLLHLEFPSNFKIYASYEKFISYDKINLPFKTYYNIKIFKQGIEIESPLKNIVEKTFKYMGCYYLNFKVDIIEGELNCLDLLTEYKKICKELGCVYDLRYNNDHYYIFIDEICVYEMEKIRNF